jgi:hypothetical protein
LDVQCNRLPPVAERPAYTCREIRLSCDRAQSGGDRMQFHQLKRRAAFNINAEC